MTVQVTRTDRITIRLDASTTINWPNGWVDAWGIATRSGVMQYPEHGAGKAEYRPPEEVFDAASLASLRGAPVTIDHPAGMVDSGNTQTLTHGWVLDVKADQPHVRVQLRLATDEILAAAADGKLELSGGYLADYTDQAGTDPADGTPYTGVQRRIRYNHLALVDAARAGHVARLTLDSRSPRTMRKKITIGSRTFTATAEQANALAKLAAEQQPRADAGIETSEVVIDGVKLILPKAMVEGIMAGLGIGASQPAPEPALEDAAPEVPAAPGQTGPDGARLDRAAIDKLVATQVAAAVATMRADAQLATSVERRATVILGAAPTATDPYGIMVEAIVRCDAERKGEAEALAELARKGDLRAAGRLEGIMDTVPRADSEGEARSDASTVGIAQQLDETRRQGKGRTDAAKVHSIDAARQANLERRQGKRKPSTTAAAK